MNCCPDGAWKNLHDKDYKPKGEVEYIEATGINVYKVGKSDKCLIWNYTIFGFDGGRLKQMADFFADHGYMVIIPDYFRGTFCDIFKVEKSEIEAFVKEHSNWSGKLKDDWEKSIFPYASRHGAITFGTVGFCWGSYLTVRLSADTRIKAGVSLHPGHDKLCMMLNESEEELLKEIKCPQAFFTALQDGPSTKAGGLGKTVLGDFLEALEFPDMSHGWSVHGDLSKPDVERDTKKAFNLTLAFLKKYL